MKQEEIINKVHNADCIEFMKEMESNSIDTIITDPPAGISFMGKDWDKDKGGRDEWIKWFGEVMSECYRVAKPGATALVWAIPRTSHWTALGIEAGGWQIKDCIYHMFGCLSEDTEILTDRGWEHYHKGIVNNRVLCYDVGNDKFIFQKPTKEFCYKNEYPAYRIQSDKTDQIVSQNHRVLIKREGSFVFQTAKSLAQEQEVCVPFLESLQVLPKNISSLYDRTNKKKQVLLNEVSGQKVITRTKRSKKKTTLYMQTMWQKVLSKVWNKKQNSLLFLQMQWNYKRKRVEKTRIQRKRWLDRQKQGKLQQKNDRSKQSSVERWHNLFQKERKLWQIQDKIYQMSERLFSYGSQRRLYYGTQVVGGSKAGQMFVENRGNTSQRPQPREQQDRQPTSFQKQSISQITRSTRATIKEIEYKGNVWCVEVPTGAFVARRKGMIFITGNSGFPKSHNISINLDKKLTGMKHRGRAVAHASTHHPDGTKHDSGTIISAHEPISNEAKLWKGWHSHGLKPAVECWWVAMKPNEGSYADNALKHGVSGLNINGSRIGTEESLERPLSKREEASSVNSYNWSKYKNPQAGQRIDNSSGLGRFPANIILDSEKYGEWTRFFYIAKASKSERNAGCDEIGGNKHCTVKPLSLMEYLCTLTKTPTGGVVLDPFFGSGTTGLACQNTDRDFIGIEREAEYVKIAEARLKANSKQKKLL